MQKFNVMTATDEEQAKCLTDRNYKPISTVHSTLEAFNEMLAQRYHRDGVFDKKYPRGSWIEIDETSSSQL